jgi:hypothetical protein
MIKITPKQPFTLSRLLIPVFVLTLVCINTACSLSSDENKSKKHSTSELNFHYSITTNNDKRIFVSVYISSDNISGEHSIDNNRVTLTNGDSLRVKTDTINLELTEDNYSSNYHASFTPDERLDSLRFTFHRPKTGESIDTIIPIPEDLTINIADGYESVAIAELFSGLSIPITWTPTTPETTLAIQLGGVHNFGWSFVDDNGYFEADSHDFMPSNTEDFYHSGKLYFVFTRSLTGPINPAFKGGSYFSKSIKYSEEITLSP